MSVKPEVDGGLREPIDTEVVIETPEHVRFRHALAGPTRRIFAYAIDTLLRAVVFALFGGLAWAGRSKADGPFLGAAGGALWLLLFALEWGYFVLFETLFDGRSPGKRALGLRVVSATGRPLGFVDSVLRNVLRAADFLPMGYALGVAVVAFDPKFRRLGDLVAGTLVVVEEKRKVEDALPKLTIPTAEELSLVPMHVALLPSEIDAIELYLRRRRRLPDARSRELADLAARAIALRVGVRYRSAGRLLEILYFRALGGPGGSA